MRWLVITGTIIWASTAAAADSLRVTLADSWGVPMLMTPGDQVLSSGVTPQGLVPDMYHLIASHLSLTPEYLVLPRKRIDEVIRKGEIDLRCYVSPSWVPNPADYLWSDSLFQMRDVVVSRNGKAPQLRGTIATVRGYTYPTLTAAFTDGRLKREDSSSQDNALSMLTYERVDLAITNELHFQYRLASWPREITATLSTTAVEVIDEYAFQCAAPLTSKPGAQRVIDAIKHLTPAIRALYQSYRDGTR